MSARLPWHQRGVRVHKVVYRAYYLAVLLYGGFLLLPALMLSLLLALGITVEPTLEATLVAVPALIGIVVVLLAIHRLSRPLKAPPRE